MTKDEIKKILEAHREWASGDPKGRRAYLRRAYLRRADLSGADLRGAYLSGADLSGADLRGAYLSRAYLRRADLSGADLSGAYLSGADLSEVKIDDLSKIAAFFVCPDFGAFTAWKKLRDGIVAQLLVPSEAQRTSSLIGRKCRAEFVEVVALLAPDGKEHPTDGYDLHAGKTLYRVGEIVRPDSYNDDIRLECTNGIHFFITRREAEEYSG
jgi:Family of unknown function (DUF5758)/Pentapeptide repeats (8 copies)